MSWSAVPDDREMYIDGMWHVGRQLRAASGVPVTWISDRAFGSGLVWADLAEKSAESGLQPFLLADDLPSRQADRVHQPWHHP
jgi:hypothetical protein